ncbi:hypothetical protein [Burkholderia pseudomultivorans]|uniref:hypothetical protein n=1 Tax=Burkholderia pseudomultivorans TaxID=1207504 RepID=UPI00188E4CF4|nr:hypothetical protein [Burkholderia pseudomultivorans]MBF5011668.1 hypothetical protein [Burkholderia pseudomultivorans]
MSAEIVDFEAVKRINQENDQDRAEYRNLADDARPFLIGSHQGSPVYDGVKGYRRSSGTRIMLRDIGMPEILPADRSRLYQIGGRGDNRKIRPAILIFGVALRIRLKHEGIRYDRATLSNR